MAPDGIFNLSFVVDSNPTPEAGTVTVNSFDAPITDFSYTLDGAPISATPSEITFETLANGGLFNLPFGRDSAPKNSVLKATRAFSGNTSAPTFSAGSLSVSSWTYSDPNNYDFETPVALDAHIAPVPEPSSAFPILGGLVALIAVRFRKFGWARS